MSERQRCPDCGADHPTDATAGLCPKCLLSVALESSNDAVVSPFAATTPQPGQFVAPAAAVLAPHFPQLEIIEPLGHGGMGAVYKARQTKLDRFVALKVIRPESADDPTFAERFTREARTLARLGHPNIVAVHDFGEMTLHREDEAPAEPHSRAARSEPRTLFYFIMEYIDGANLRDLIQRGPLPPQQALAIVSQVCDALQYAHDEGIVHRDIKPENVLLDRRGRVRIADFGLAKLATAAPENFTLTGTHQVMGTPRYMAPEQMEGSHLVDHRADIYSLGVVLYEMLTGELPLGRFEPPSRKASIDARVDDVVHRALAKDPVRRYQRASELRRDVESVALAAESPPDVTSGLDAAERAAGLRGPSTILEQHVAGVVNWFREGTDSGAAPLPPSDRAAIRRKVRAPAVTLMLFGVLLLFPAAVLLTNGFDIADGNDRSPWQVGVAMMAAGLGVVGLSGLIVRGGWHMLSLEGLRPALLAGILAPPVGVWALIVLSRRDVKAAFASGSSSSAVLADHAEAAPVRRVGRDWVTLTRDQVESDALPDVCLVCGQPAQERVNRTFDSSPGWAALLLLAGFIPGVIALMLTSKSMRVACPLCPQHRSHWSRLTWVAGAGWLLIILLGAVGYFAGMAVSVPHRDGSTAHVAGLAIGAGIGLILWLAPVIYLASTRVGVKRITHDEITLENVAPLFAKAAGPASRVERTSTHGSVEKNV